MINRLINGRKRPTGPKSRGQAWASATRKNMQNNMSGSHKCAKELAQSVVNPFEFSACIPDGAPGVGKFSIKETFTLTTGGAPGTSYGIAMNLDPLAFFKTDTGTTAATATYAGNWQASTANATYSALYGRFRAVSGGMRLTYVGNSVSDSGLIVAGEVTPSFALSNFNGATSTGMSNSLMYVKTTPLRNGIKITWRPIDPDDQGAFVASSGALTGVNSTLSTPYLLAQVFSAQTGGISSVLVEMVGNFEGQYRSTQLSPGGITTRSTNPAEPGWYEWSHGVYNKVAPIVDAMYRFSSATKTAVPLIEDA